MFHFISMWRTAKITLPLLALLCVTSCNHEPSVPAPTPTDANRPADFKSWMKLHENELTSARIAFQVAKNKQILPGQSFNRESFNQEYKNALQAQGITIKTLPGSVRTANAWNANQQTTAQYLDSYQVQGALKQYVLTLEQNLRKAATKLLQDHATPVGVTNGNSGAARTAYDDEWGPSEEQTRISASQELENSAEALSASGSVSYQEMDAIWMTTGSVMNFLPEFINIAKQEVGFGGIDISPSHGQNLRLGSFGKFLKRLFNVVVTVAIAATTIIVATVAMVASSISYGAPLTPYLGVIYSSVVGKMIGGIYDAVSGNNYICFFPGDGGRY